MTYAAKLLPLVLLWMLPASVQAQYTYVTNGSAISITSYTGPDGPVGIPGQINGLVVTRIEDRAFFNRYRVTSITIPDSVTSIGARAFEGCYGLTGELTIPHSVTRIGDYAFAGCSSLASVTIGNGVKQFMGQWTFSQCAGLTSVTIGNNVTSIEVGAFSGCSSLTSVTVPDSVGGIGDYAFSACAHLASVTLGTNVTAIGSEAFYQCARLTSVVIPDKVISIRSGAFRDCASLTSVQLGASVLYIQSMAFFNCPLLTGAFFKGGPPQAGTDVFGPDSPATVYYLSGTPGWGPTWGGRPTALWSAQVRTSQASFGVRTNQFGFDIAWVSGRSVVVEASEALANPVWLPVRTNTLTGDSVYFSDPEWTNYPGRFYRLRSP